MSRDLTHHNVSTSDSRTSKPIVVNSSNSLIFSRPCTAPQSPKYWLPGDNEMMHELLPSLLIRRSDGPLCWFFASTELPRLLNTPAALARLAVAFQLSKIEPNFQSQSFVVCSKGSGHFCGHPAFLSHTKADPLTHPYKAASMQDGM